MTERIEAVYRAEHPRLWRALVAFTGDREIASDAEAEAFAQALRRGDDIRNPAAWIWRTAFAVARGLFADRSESHSQDPAVAVEYPEPVIELLGLLDDLTEQQRACVVLRYVGSYRPAEIAELLGTSAGTVRVQLHRAHAQLRQVLEMP